MSFFIFLTQKNCLFHIFFIYLEKMDFDVKYVIRFLKDENIYRCLVEIITEYIKTDGKWVTKSRNFIEFIRNNFIVNGSCLNFFEWVCNIEYKYCLLKNGTIRLGHPLKYVSDFNIFIDKIIKHENLY